MRFRIMSDIHNEMFMEYYGVDYEIPSLDDDKNTILILAGDIGLLSKPKTWRTFIEKCSNQFKEVFVIEGNHEWYHGNITRHSWSKVIKEHSMKNVKTGNLLYEDEKIAVIGTTLWTDFDNGNPISMYDVGVGLNDYNLIRVGEDYRRLDTSYILSLHKKQKAKLFADVDYYSSMGYKIIVVTHHHPSRQGINPKYCSNNLNGGYVSNLDAEVAKHKIEYWICGHTHIMMEYVIGDTKVICNSKGYPHEDIFTGFNQLKTIEL